MAHSLLTSRIIPANTTPHNRFIRIALWTTVIITIITILGVQLIDSVYQANTDESGIGNYFLVILGGVIVLLLLFPRPTISRYIAYFMLFNATISNCLIYLDAGVIQYPSGISMATAAPIPPVIACILQRSRRVVAVTYVLPLVCMWISVFYHSKPTGTGNLADVSTAFRATCHATLIVIVVQLLIAKLDASHEASVQARAREREAQSQAQTERKANAAKTRFVSVMSHELRNPLQAIQLQVDMLKRIDMGTRATDYLNGISRASGILLETVNSVLDLTKIESGVIILEQSVLDLRTECELVLGSMAPACLSKGVQPVLQCDPWLDCRVYGDATRLGQVVRNLVSNAVKFTASGEVVLELMCDPTDRVPAPEGCPKEAGTAVAWSIVVRDTGIGISDEGVERLFLEFSQVDQSTTREYGGTGLGLFIVKQLVEMMQGSVTVESREGVGSTFGAKVYVVPVVPLLGSPPLQPRADGHAPSSPSGAGSLNGSAKAPGPLCLANMAVGKEHAEESFAVFVAFPSAIMVKTMMRLAEYYLAGVRSVSLDVCSSARGLLAKLQEQGPGRSDKVLVLVDEDMLHSVREFVLNAVKVDPQGFLVVPVSARVDTSATESNQHLEPFVYVMEQPVYRDYFCNTLNDMFAGVAQGRATVRAVDKRSRSSGRRQGRSRGRVRRVAHSPVTVKRSSSTVANVANGAEGDAVEASERVRKRSVSYEPFRKYSEPSERMRMRRDSDERMRKKSEPYERVRKGSVLYDQFRTSSKAGPGNLERDITRSTSTTASGGPTMTSLAVSTAVASGWPGDAPVDGSSLASWSMDDASSSIFVESCTVLVVDDFALVRSLVCSILADEHIHAVGASDGREAVGILRERYHEVDLVLMDCEMPIMDGFEATAKIRALEESLGIPEYRRKPICAMTANAMQEDVQRCLSSSMDAFLPKPVRAHELVGTVRRLVAQARMRLSGQREVQSGERVRRNLRKPNGDVVGDPGDRSPRRSQHRGEEASLHRTTSGNKRSKGAKRRQSRGTARGKGAGSMV